jgi:hypothetical protein
MSKMTGKSLVAGIVDAKDGLRIVVTDGLIEAHIGPGERAFVLPGYKVQEPVDMRDVPALVARVERYVARKMRHGTRRPDHLVNLSVDSPK